MPAAFFCPAITYCPPKNTAILLSFALTPYAVKPERRTDSKPFRRRFVRKAGFGSCRRKILQNHFRQSFESSPESRGSQTSRVLLVLFVQAKRIKPFPFRKVRGFPNLDSARHNGGFAQTKLKPFPKGDSRFCKPRISAHKQKLRTNPIKSFCRSAASPPPCGDFFLLLFVKYKK